MLREQADVRDGSQLFHELLNRVCAAFGLEVKTNLVSNVLEFDWAFGLVVGDFDDMPTDVGFEGFADVALFQGKDCF